MAIDVSVTYSPGWWLERLSRELYARASGRRWSPMSAYRRDLRPGLDLLDDYVRGDPPLPHVAEGWADAMRPFIRQSRMNYAELVVESVRDRMIPLGFSTAVDSDEDGDQIAARIAAGNDLDLRFADVYRWMLALGDAYMIVGGPGRNGVPVISAEDPREVITADDPATGDAIAALKMFRDEWTGDRLAYVYVPGAVWVARRPAGSIDAGFFSSAWEWDPALSAAYPDALADLVPVVRFRNRAGIGEFEPHLDVLDRINDGIFSRVAIAKYQAFRQRAIKGLQETSDGAPPAPDGSNVIDYSDVFTADPGAFWQMPPNTEMWESQPVDLGSVRLAVKDDVEALCAVTRTPLFYVTPDAAAGSAEGASTQREGLVYRTEDRRRRAGSGNARAMSIALRIMGETARADVLAIRTLWQPAERFSLTERASAAAQAAAGGLPQRRIWLDIWQYRPEEIPVLEREEADDLRRDAEKQALLAEVAPRPASPPPAPVAASSAVA